MQQHIPVQQIILDKKLIGIELHDDERFYLNTTETKSYRPSIETKSPALSEAFNPILHEQNQDEENAAVESLLGQLLESVKAIDQRREQSLLEMQQVAIELAIAAASHLVETVIEEDRFGIEDLIQSTFEQAGSDRSLRFSLHPDDLELLQRRISVTKSYQELRRLEFIEDFQLPRGSFQIHLPDGQTWLTGISLRLAEIRKHWLAELDAAQVERRQTETTNSSLRRFPDRRETA
ncbi:flagellar assembly protein FliH [Planctomicrobium sp.]|nr:FliH/SctL family protein [Planctomicrobium sp.]MDB4733511.1 flagellar assembly protein FliH [Planctomicrobium sp.]